MTLALHVKGNKMIKQIATILAALTLLVSATGCSGMKNFLFGRGAACSSCASAAPSYGIAAPMEPGCGYEPTCGYERPLPGPRRGCGLLNGRSTCNAGPDCACHSGTQSYMPSEIGSYGNEVHDPYAYGGEVIGSEVMGDGYNGYAPQSYPSQGRIINEGMVPGSVYPNMTPQDNFDTRSQGIIQGAPTPAPTMQP